MTLFKYAFLFFSFSFFLGFTFATSEALDINFQIHLNPTLPCLAKLGHMHGIFMIKATILFQ